MCEFCHQHGEGKKWYLQAKNYSDDLLSDVRRRKFIEDFVSHPEELSRAARKTSEIYKNSGESHNHEKDEEKTLRPGNSHRGGGGDLRFSQFHYEDGVHLSSHHPGQGETVLLRCKSGAARRNDDRDCSGDRQEFLRGA